MPIAGLTNRWLSRIAAEVLEAFPGSFRASAHARTIGNPVRADIAAVAEPAARFAGRDIARAPAGVRRQPGRAAPERRRAPGAVALGSVRGARRCATRPASADSRPRAPPTSQLEVEAEVLPFIDDMAAAYAWADLALCRAGAMTIAELQAAGLGALLVPLPAATDDHQTKNAEAMVRIGAGRVLQERDLTPDSLSACIAELTADRSRLLKMAQARALARNIDAAARLADLCMAAAEGSPA